MALELYSQSTQVINASGGSVFNEDISVEYAIGEATSSTHMFTADQRTVISGILQPQYKVVTSIDDQSTGAAVYVFPNPTTGLLSVQGLESQTVVLYCASGKEIKLPLHNGLLDMSALPNGIYMLQTSDINHQFLNSIKIIKE